MVKPLENARIPSLFDFQPIFENVWVDVIDTCPLFTRVYIILRASLIECERNETLNSFSAVSFAPVKTVKCIYTYYISTYRNLRRSLKLYIHIYTTRQLNVTRLHLSDQYDPYDIYNINLIQYIYILYTW